MRKRIINEGPQLPGGFGFGAKKGGQANAAQNQGGGLPGGFGFKRGGGAQQPSGVNPPQNAGGQQKELKPKLTHCESKMVDVANGQKAEILEGYLVFIQFLHICMHLLIRKQMHLLYCSYIY